MLQTLCFNLLSSTSSVFSTKQEAGRRAKQGVFLLTSVPFLLDLVYAQGVPPGHEERMSGKATYVKAESYYLRKCVPEQMKDDHQSQSAYSLLLLGWTSCKRSCSGYGFHQSGSPSTPDT